MTFDGQTYEPALDHDRLSTQLERVKALMMDGEWRTLDEISSTVGHCSTPSASARLRDIRKARFGAFTVERKRIGKGLFAYRVTKPLPSRQEELFQ